MRGLARFGRFWYDFIVGDDWTIAAAVIAVVTITSAVAHSGNVACLIVPLGVAVVLSASVWRVARAHQNAASIGAANESSDPGAEEPR